MPAAMPRKRVQPKPPTRAEERPGPAATAYIQGFQASKARESTTICPYGPTNPNRDLWHQGFAAARGGQED